MSRFREFLAVLMVVLMLNSSLHASIFGEENATLTAILTEEVIQTLQIAEQITKVKALIDAANQTINLARESYRQFQYIKNYTVDDLLSDAKQGFCKGLSSSTDTTCDEWTSSYREMEANVEMISGGETEQFIAYRSQWDTQTKSFLKNMYHGSASAFVYPKIAPKVSSYYGWDKHENDAEYVINQALVKSGLYKSVIETTQDGYVVRSAIGDFLREADNSKNLVAQGQGVQLMQDQQRNRALTEQNHRDKARFLHEENTKQQVRGEREVFMDTYREESKKAGKKDPFKTDTTGNTQSDKIFLNN